LTLLNDAVSAAGI